MTSMIVRTALLINTTSRLTRDTPIRLEDNSLDVSRVATKTLSDLPQQDRSASSGRNSERFEDELHYYKRQRETNRQCQEISRAFRARL